MKTFQFKPGSRFPIAADVAGQELDRLHTLHGELKPDDVVHAAQDPESPLHAVFDWEDTRAAHKWRVHQARNLIRSVTVTIEKSPTKAPIRAFVHVEKSYRETLEVVSSAPQFAQVLSQLESKVAGLKLTIAQLEALAQTEAPDKALQIIALKEAYRRVDEAASRIQ